MFKRTKNERKDCNYRVAALQKHVFYFRIEETTSSGNLTVVAGETVMLVCTVLDLGDKSVSTSQ